MLFILGLIVRAPARLLRVGGHDDGAKDLEILVLRHQLRVLQRRSPLCQNRVRRPPFFE